MMPMQRLDGVSSGSSKHEILNIHVELGVKAAAKVVVDAINHNVENVCC